MCCEVNEVLPQLRLCVFRPEILRHVSHVTLVTAGHPSVVEVRGFVSQSHVRAAWFGLLSFQFKLSRREAEGEESRLKICKSGLPFQLESDVSGPCIVESHAVSAQVSSRTP